MPKVVPIDKVALLLHLRQIVAELENTLNNADEACATYDALLLQMVTLSAVMETIMKFDEIDYEPVRHGEWHDKGSLSCRCNQCGCKSNVESSYCPNCGAKMDGGKNT